MAGNGASEEEAAKKHDIHSESEKGKEMKKKKRRRVIKNKRKKAQVQSFIPRKTSRIPSSGERGNTVPDYPKNKPLGCSRRNISTIQKCMKKCKNFTFTLQNQEGEQFKVRHLLLLSPHGNPDF
jgi:hypothetical protein